MKPSCLSSFDHEGIKEALISHCFYSKRKHWLDSLRAVLAIVFSKNQRNQWFFKKFIVKKLLKTLKMKKEGHSNNVVVVRIEEEKEEGEEEEE